MWWTPAGSSAAATSIPPACVAGARRSVRSTAGFFRYVTLIDEGSIFAPPKLSNLSFRWTGDLTSASPAGDTKTTFGPRVTPARMARLKASGAGSFASDSVMRTSRAGLDCANAAPTAPTAMMAATAKVTLVIGPSPPSASLFRFVVPPTWLVHAWRRRATALFPRAAAVTHDRVGRPEQWMGIAEHGLARSVGKARPVEHRHRGLAQRLPARDPGIGGLPAKEIGYKLAGGRRAHRPVSDQDCPRAGIKEGPPETGGRLCTGTGARSGVAGRQHHPVGIELECENLLHREQAVALRSGHRRRGERERRLGEPAEVAGNEAVGGEHDNAVFRQTHASHGLLVRRLAEVKNFRWIGLQRERDRFQLVCGIRQARKQPELRIVHAAGLRAIAPPQRYTTRGHLGHLHIFGGRRRFGGLLRVEEGVAEADQHLALGRRGRQWAQRPQRRRRWDHGHRVAAREPRHG